MRTVKFRYRFDNHAPIIFTLQEIESGRVANFVLREGLKIVNRSEFTGLTDRNGKEIYEGDVVKITSKRNGIYTAEIMYYKGAFGYMNMMCECIENPKYWKHDYDKVDSGWFFGGFSLLNGQDYSKHEECNAHGVLKEFEVVENINVELV